MAMIERRKKGLGLKVVEAPKKGVTIKSKRVNVFNKEVRMNDQFGYGVSYPPSFVTSQ